MEHWSKLRKWVNRNDGKYFRVDEIHYNPLQAVGILLIAGGVIMLSGKLPNIVIPIWVSGSALFAGAVLFYVGCTRNKG